MTKSEYRDLYDQVLYGHDADLQIKGHRFFVEWNENEITVYHMYKDSGVAVAVLHGKNRAEIVEALFEYSFSNGKSINQSYQDIIVLDIE